MRRVMLIVAFLFLLVLSAVPATAAEGYYIGLFVPTETIGGSAGGGVSSGTGWGARFGYSFSRYFSLEADYSASQHDTSVIMLQAPSADLTGLSANLKLSFPLTSLDSAQVMTLMPYLMFGLAHYELSTPTKAKDDGFQWGLGIELYLFKEMSIQAGLTKTNVTFNNDPRSFTGKDGNIKRVEVGLTYHFL